MSFLWNPPEKAVPIIGEQMFEAAMIITVLSVMYLTVWSYRRHTSSMAGLAYAIAAVAASVFVGAEFIFCMVKLSPLLYWNMRAGVITAIMTLFTTCMLFDELGRRAKADKMLRDKSR